MEIREEGRPIAVRDYPLGCRPAGEDKRIVELERQGSASKRGKSKADDLIAEGPVKGGVRVLKRRRRQGDQAGPSMAVEDLPAMEVVSINPQDISREDAERRRIVNIMQRFDALRRFYLQQQETGVITTTRPDSTAGSYMMKMNEDFKFKDVGPVPGVRVGDCYFYRFELMLVGLHRQSQAGISFLGPTSRFGEQVACSVIASGGYEDDEDNGETLTYTGQGGNNYSGDRRQGKDQVPMRGNLALQNSWKHKTPVRVIRGHQKVASSPSTKVYSYDGLYTVESYRMEMGNSGYKVFKFFLRRLPGQPELGSNVVRFIGKLASHPLQRVGLVIADISGEKEPVPVCVVNTVDADAGPPEPFNYTPTILYSHGLKRPPPPTPCTCELGCHHVANNCCCLSKNIGGLLPYNHDGNLVRARPIVYECGDHCRCRKCLSKVSQKGVRHRLEIFKTESKGWGVRSWDFIPSGSFVCEYTGDLIDNSSADDLENDEYLFNLDFKKGNEARWGDISDVNEVASDVACPVSDGADYVIDARKHGNVARFINHSCEPNLFVQCVLYDHHDLRFPHIMLFANSNIPPLRELSYDYGYELDSVLENGEVKRKVCHCGAPNCRRRMY